MSGIRPNAHGVGIVHAPMISFAPGAMAARAASIAQMCLAEARPSVQVMFSLRFLAGAVLAVVAGPGHPAQAVRAGIIWWLVIVSIYLFNGICDVREDRVNGSRRPIARGRLSLPVAKWATGCCAAAGLCGAVAAGGSARWLCPAMLLLGYLYSGQPGCLKRRPMGSPMCGLLAGMATYYAGYSAYTGGEPAPSTGLIVFAAAMSLWIAVAGSMSKDLSDIAGDAAAGRRTLAAVRGDQPVRIALAAAAPAVAMTFLAVACTVTPQLVPPAATAGIGAAVLSAASMSDRSRGCRQRRRLPYRAFMVTQYGVHLCLIVSIAGRYAGHVMSH